MVDWVHLNCEDSPPEASQWRRAALHHTVGTVCHRATGAQLKPMLPQQRAGQAAISFAAGTLHGYRQRPCRHISHMGGSSCARLTEKSVMTHQLKTKPLMWTDIVMVRPMRHTNREVNPKNEKTVLQFCWHSFGCRLFVLKKYSYGCSLNHYNGVRVRARVCVCPRVWAHLLWPWAAAKCKDVNPFSSDKSAGDPENSSSFTHSEDKRQREKSDDIAAACCCYTMKHEWKSVTV